MFYSKICNNSSKFVFDVYIFCTFSLNYKSNILRGKILVFFNLSSAHIPQFIYLYLPFSSISTKLTVSSSCIPPNWHLGYFNYCNFYIISGFIWIWISFYSKITSIVLLFFIYNYYRKYIIKKILTYYIIEKSKISNKIC